jgi:hypothetical protein
MDENGVPRTGRPHARVLNLTDGGFPIGAYAALPQSSACHDYGHDDARDRGIPMFGHRRRRGTLWILRKWLMPQLMQG